MARCSKNHEGGAMIHAYGKGRPGDLAHRILHHATGVTKIAFAITAGLWAHEAQRDESRHHRLHIGKGAGAWALYLDNGQCFALRSDDYESVNVHVGSVRPLGPVALTMRTPSDVDKFWKLLDKALAA
jgi:hypothetical protein